MRENEQSATSLANVDKWTWREGDVLVEEDAEKNATPNEAEQLSLEHMRRKVRKLAERRYPRK
jgi:hypothetical protein